jgi:hypothetical protein
MACGYNFCIVFFAGSEDQRETGRFSVDGSLIKKGGCLKDYKAVGARPRIRAAKISTDLQESGTLTLFCSSRMKRAGSNVHVVRLLGPAPPPARLYLKSPNPSSTPDSNARHFRMEFAD